MLYTLSVNSNGYVPFLIDMLNTIVRVGVFAKLSPLAVVYFLYTAGKYCILLMW